MKREVLFSASALLIAMAGPAMGQVVFSDGLDDNTADVTIAAQADTATSFIDYSSFSVGLESFSIAEAPNQVAGSAATSGVLVQANFNGTASAANVIAGATPQVFSGNYFLTYDIWINVADPVPSGGTEQLLWGVGKNDTTALGRNNRFDDGTGTWGWLAGENGYGTEDAAIFNATTELADLGDSQAGEAQPFIDAFTGNPLTVGNPTAANAWTEVLVTVVDGETSVFFNGVEFFSETTPDTTGFAFAGYEDPFSSISGAQDFQFGIIDNIVVTEGLVPEPASLALLGLGGLAALGRRRRA